MFKQLVTSGINMDKLNQSDITTLNKVVEMEQYLYKDYCFIHDGLNTLYNYGIVKFKKEANSIYNKIQVDYLELRNN